MFISDVFFKTNWFLMLLLIYANNPIVFIYLTSFFKHQLIKKIQNLLKEILAWSLFLTTRYLEKRGNFLWSNDLLWQEQSNQLHVPNIKKFGLRFIILLFLKLIYVSVKKNNGKTFTWNNWCSIRSCGKLVLVTVCRGFRLKFSWKAELKRVSFLIFECHLSVLKLRH